MAILIPRSGAIGRFFNPGPFNMKEHASITLIASAASQSALATEGLGSPRLVLWRVPKQGGRGFHCHYFPVNRLRAGWVTSRGPCLSETHALADEFAGYLPSGVFA